MIPWNQIAVCDGKTAAEKHNLCFLVNGKETIMHGACRTEFIILCSRLFCLCHHRLETPYAACMADLPSLRDSDTKHSPY